MAKEIDIDKYDESYVSKHNRRIRQEAEENRIVVGPRPITVVRKETRKQRDRRRNLITKDALK